MKILAGLLGIIIRPWLRYYRSHKEYIDRKVANTKEFLRLDPSDEED